MKSKDSTALCAIASDLPESDLTDLVHIRDAVCAMRRKLVSIDALIRAASSYAEGLGGPARELLDENRIVTLVYELEARIENVLAFADEAEKLEVAP